MPFSIKDILENNACRNKDQSTTRTESLPGNHLERIAHGNYHILPQAVYYPFRLVSNELQNVSETERVKYEHFSYYYWAYFKSLNLLDYADPKYWQRITPRHWFQGANYNHRNGGQVRFNSKQIVILEKKFKNKKYITPEECKVLAHTLNLTDRQVKTWFQNRRAKWRRYQVLNSNLSRGMVKKMNK